MDNTEIRSILQSIGALVPPSSQLILVGGSALAMLGSPRLTIDIDFLGDDVHPSELHKFIIQAAKELQVHVEPVPLDRFIPLPPDGTKRNIYVGQFGNLKVFVADPYSIALSKLDRGFDTDIEDIVFLIQSQRINIGKLEHVVQEALPQANNYDLNPDILEHLQELRNRLV